MYSISTGLNDRFDWPIKSVLHIISINCWNACLLHSEISTQLWVHRSVDIQVQESPDAINHFPTFHTMIFQRHFLCPLNRMLVNSKLHQVPYINTRLYFEQTKLHLSFKVTILTTKSWFLTLFLVHSASISYVEKFVQCYHGGHNLSHSISFLYTTIKRVSLCMSMQSHQTSLDSFCNCCFC